ncbi:unnamed protein product [Spodoptera exigua]|nr:unnamed protein product [Spodoptera exigua]
MNGNLVSHNQNHRLLGVTDIRGIGPSVTAHIRQVTQRGGYFPGFFNLGSVPRTRPQPRNEYQPCRAQTVSSSESIGSLRRARGTLRAVRSGQVLVGRSASLARRPESRAYGSWRSSPYSDARSVIYRSLTRSASSFAIIIASQKQ